MSEKSPVTRSHVPQEPLTAVSHLFGGALQSRVRCGACGATSDTVDPFLDLSLELLGCTTLLAALRRFTAPETLTGANAYKCERCRRCGVPPGSTPSTQRS